ncbi:MAG: hypothetical protein ACXVH1_37545 [Solirubrobacteraceae bacterium]
MKLSSGPSLAAIIASRSCVRVRIELDHRDHNIPARLLCVRKQRDDGAETTRGQFDVVAGAAGGATRPRTISPVSVWIHSADTHTFWSVARSG